ncbi:MAG TPA: sigma-E factor negative regulatory protein [Caldimonas sp.]|jgi:sigma-E factor negative regulatory protein RseA|nr:sigma-E factor negative regulatory protein [Caldimonas sp.]
MAIGSFDDSAKERLSALADGELDSTASAASCAAWSADAALRADWHAWHLIGDVLRSEDLAADPCRDRRLFAAVQARLRSEPVVLAPTPALAAAVGPRFGRRARPGRWAGGAAVAAGVVLVVGTFAVIRPGDSPAPERLALGDGALGAASTVARAPVARAPVVVDIAAPPVAIVADSKLIRDAQLDRYLEAHKQFAGTSALGVPSTFLRSATVDSAWR